MRDFVALFLRATLHVVPLELWVVLGGILLPQMNGMQSLELKAVISVSESPRFLATGNTHAEARRQVASKRRLID